LIIVCIVPENIGLKRREEESTNNEIEVVEIEMLDAWNSE